MLSNIKKYEATSWKIIREGGYFHEKNQVRLPRESKTGAKLEELVKLTYGKWVKKKPSTKRKIKCGSNIKALNVKEFHF